MFSDKMFGICLYYSKSRADAEDLLHDGFLRVFENINKYKSDNFEAWLRRVFVNLALMKYRKDKRNTSVSEIETVKVVHGEFAENNEMHSDELMTMISKLPPQYQMVFNLYAIEGYKHSEISQMLKITEGTSKSNLSRARKILQDQLNSTDGYRKV